MVSRLIVKTTVVSLATAYCLRVVARAAQISGVNINTLGIPLLFVVAAAALSHHTHVNDWAQLVVPRTPLSVIAKYILLSGTVALVLQFLALSMLSMEYRLLVVPRLTPALLRSLVGSPISEELLFRGWLLGWLSRLGLPSLRIGRLQLSYAAIVSSLSFSLVHVFSAPPGLIIAKLVVVFIIGLILAEARRESLGLLTPMACHFAINLIGSTLLQPI